MLKKALVIAGAALMLVGFMPLAPVRAQIVTDTKVNLNNRNELVQFMYTCFLGRPADEAGLNFWSAGVGPNADSIKHLYLAFFVSIEYQNKVQTMSNRDFVAQWYRCSLFREPDQSGLDFWTNLMNQGRSRQEMFNAFMESIEFNEYIMPQLIRIAGVIPGLIVTTTKVHLADKQELVEQMYSCLLQRTADQDGRDFWVSQLQPNAGSVKHLYHAFFVSIEYGQVSDRLSNQAFLDQWYRCALFRQIDTAGLNFWLDLMNQGRSRQEMFNAFMESIEFNEYILPQLVEIAGKSKTQQSSTQFFVMPSQPAPNPETQLFVPQQPASPPSQPPTVPRENQENLFLAPVQSVPAENNAPGLFTRPVDDQGLFFRNLF